MHLDYQADGVYCERISIERTWLSTNNQKRTNVPCQTGNRRLGQSRSLRCAIARL